MTSASRPSSQASSATCRLGRSQGCNGRLTTGSPDGSAPKCSRSRRRAGDSGAGVWRSAQSANRFRAPASSSGSTLASSHPPVADAASALRRDEVERPEPLLALVERAGLVAAALVFRAAPGDEGLEARSRVPAVEEQVLSTLRPQEVCAEVAL